MNYFRALKARVLAEKIGEEAWLQADELLTIARRELVAAEIAQPTNQELVKSNRIRALRNRGLDG